MTWDEQVREPWPAVARALSSRLAGRDDIDHCAEVTLLGAASGVIVHVVLADGRSAVRRVDEPRQLDSVVEAMLILLPSPPAPPASASAMPSAPPVASVSPVSSVAASAAPEASAPPVSSEVPGPRSSPPPAAIIEAGLGASLHLTIRPGYFGYGLAGFVQVETNRWLLGSTVRWEADNIGTGQNLPTGFHMQSFTLGAMVGRRWRLDELRLDTMLGPQMLVENQESHAYDPDTVSNLHGDISAGALARLSGTNFYTALSTEFFPHRVRSRRYDPFLPRLPSWGVGLSVGMVWGSP